MPPVYQEPLLLKDGDYWPPGISFASVASAGTGLASQDAQKPAFEGTVAGIRLYSFAHAASDPAVDRAWCVVDHFVDTDAVTISYLPGGTYANGPEYAGTCIDGRVSFVQRDFTTKHGTFEVKFYFGEPAFGHDASSDRVVQEVVDGHAAVVIRPVTDQGFGRGWAAYATRLGAMIVDGRNLPVTELTQILGGAKCAKC